MRLPLSDSDKGIIVTWKMSQCTLVHRFKRYHDQDIPDLISFGEFKLKYNTKTTLAYEHIPLIERLSKEQVDKIKMFKFKQPECYD